MRNCAAVYMYVCMCIYGSESTKPTQITHPYTKLYLCTSMIRHVIIHTPINTLPTHTKPNETNSEEEVLALEERFASLVSGSFEPLQPKVEEVKTLAAKLQEHGAWRLVLLHTCVTKKADPASPKNVNQSINTETHRPAQVPAAAAAAQRGRGRQQHEQHHHQPGHPARNP